MPILHLIRHGEPDIRGIFLGTTDRPLSERGRAEAAAKLSSLPVESVFSSPLLRAFQTAEYLPSRQPVEVVPEFAEMHFGDWEGRSWDDIEREWPDLAQQKLNYWVAVAPPGGEDWPAFEQRVLRAWHGLLPRIQSSPGPVAMVAHMVVNSVIVRQLRGDDPLTFQQKYCEVLSLDI